MNRSYRILPVYTGDVSGVCSALFELGGMTVMHDPSGCNSTYNTHDETRWYDHDSLIFLSGLSELDAILGNDDKLIHDVVAAAEQTKPKFITLVNSPIPYLNGTDFEGISRVIQGETGLPTFHIPTNGMHDYITGGGGALAEVARRFVTSPEQVRPRSLNLLGVTPLDFGAEGSVASLRRTVARHGWELVSCWAMGDGLEALQCAGEAAVNLVVSSMGLAAAKVLRQRWGTPYVVGTPIGPFADVLFAALEDAVTHQTCSVPYLERPTQGTGRRCLIGEPVTSGSLAAAITLRTGRPVEVLCPLEQHTGLLSPLDHAVKGEEALETRLQGADAVIADPLYRPVCPQGAAFYELPHVAFSGRCFRKRIKNLMELELP
jgi:hypothetical protein